MYWYKKNICEVIYCVEQKDISRNKFSLHSRYPIKRVYHLLYKDGLTKILRNRKLKSGKRSYIILELKKRLIK